MTEGVAVTVTTLWIDDSALEDQSVAVSVAPEDHSSVVVADSFDCVLVVRVRELEVEPSPSPSSCRRTRTADSIVTMLSSG
jgi:hypothetical protein